MILPRQIKNEVQLEAECQSGRNYATEIIYT